MNEINSPQSGRPAGAPARPTGKAPLLILLVDDDADVCRLNAEVLTNFGFHVTIVADGEAAWQAMSMMRYDVVVTDNKMPRISGVELLRKIHSSKMAVPVIMVTGTYPEEEFSRSPWLQPAAMLLKPYSISDLLLSVKRVLPGNDVHDQAPQPRAGG